MNRPRSAGLTLVEVLVAIVIVAILAYLALPTITSGPVKGQKTQTLSNMKQLHLATEQMFIDGVTTGNRQLGWPGDTGSTFSNWAGQLVPEYLSTNDFRKLCSAPGIVVPEGMIPTMAETGLRVYAVTEDSPGATVFITSANFTNTPTGGDALARSGVPYGDKGFVVFRKAGDGAILLPRQVGMTNIIGAYAPLCR